MKKLSILFVSVLALGMSFVSCSKDDDTAEASIEGKWNLSKMSMTANGVTSKEEDNPENTVGCTKNYLEIKTGGVVVYGDYEGSACTLSKETGTWSKEGNKITIKLGTDTDIYEIVSVTDSGLTLRYTLTLSGQSFLVNDIFTK
ncbi:lipocalin family protein [Flavobacterium sp. ZT3R18]|uniref:lipocalin family protein n=1 Tax=Flavobacterium sp. ZT3R18 TaxID=2594429 RepID=UPI00117B315E|nr:lipocalin family protein [Flavobacterium sp. ZT3R18]TRX37366.1 lipocalin family protein [Flavobacterium sp. ZT3R18]